MDWFSIYENRNRRSGNTRHNSAISDRRRLNFEVNNAQRTILADQMLFRGLFLTSFSPNVLWFYEKSEGLLV